MANWAIIKDDKVINRIVADSKEIAEAVSGFEAIDDEGWIATGFEWTPDGWRAPYPTDGKDYIWNDEYKFWVLVIYE